MPANRWCLAGSRAANERSRVDAGSAACDSPHGEVSTGQQVLTLPP
jgi:hypothetical protein